MFLKLQKSCNIFFHYTMYVLLWLTIAITPIICIQQNSHRLLFNFAQEIKFGYTNNLTKSTTIIKDLTYVFALDYIHKDSLICWTDNEREHIACVVQNEGGHHGDKIIYVKNVISNAIACDWITRKIYWTDTTYKHIEVISLDTRHRAVVYWEDFDNPRGIALDPLKGLIFWTDWGTSAKIETGSMDGDASARKKIVDKNLIWPNSITLDIQRHQIYWTDGSYRIVEAANYDGGNRRILINGLVYPFSITNFQQKLYFTDWKAFCIQYYNLVNDVTEPRILLDSQEPIMDVKAYNISLQPHQKTGCEMNNGGCAQLCLLSSTNESGYSCNCQTGIKLLDNKRSCALQSEHLLLLAQRRAVNIIYLDTADHSSKKLPLKNVGRIMHVDYDPVEQFIYWTDTDGGNIRCSKLDGSQQLEVINTGLEKPEGIAIDWVSRNIYWTDAALDRIEAYSLKTKVKKTIIFENIEKPRAIIVSPLDGLLFWSEWSNEKPKIERAELDGTERLVLVHDDIGWPNGLTADTEKKKIYWGDAKLDRIEVVDFEGHGRKVIINVNLPHIFSLTYLDNKLYWTDWQLRSLEHISINDTKHRVSLGEDIYDIMGVKAFSTKVINSTSPCTVNNGQCSQLCFTKSSNYHVCDCTTDYILDSDNKTCIRPVKYVVLHSNDKIIRISTTLNTSQQAVPVRVKHVTAIDVDNKDGTLYWSDEKYQYISRSLLDGSSSKIILEGGLKSPDSIAVDWISRNIYWADSRLGRIEVITHDGAFRRTLIWTNLKEPRNLLVDPRIGQLFFSEYDDTAGTISTAWMDGSNKKPLIQDTNRVTGMTVDYKQRLLYWIHSVDHASRIETCNLDGKNRKIVYNLGIEKQYFLTLDKEFLYVGSPKDGSIIRVHKSNYTQGRTINTNFKRSSGMKMVEKYETIGRNNCSISNGDCQYLCLVKPGFSNYSTNTICACPTHYTKNGSNCNPPVDFLMISQPSALHRLSLNKDECPDSPLSIHGMKEVKTIQYDAGNDYFFWLEKSHSIGNNFNKSLNTLGRIAEYINIYDIALDPISKLLFWTCSASDVVNATRLTNSSSIMTIFKGNGTQKPRLIAIHPERGDIFWSDDDTPPGIVHSKYNGYFLEKIDSSLKIVKAMFVDRRENMLYFSITDNIIQYNLNKKMSAAIESSDINKMAKFVVLDIYLYWLDTDNSHIERALITNNGQLREKTTIIEMSEITDLIAVTVEDDKNQQHPCSEKKNFGNCSHICTAVLSELTLSECSCPLYTTLNEDKKTCSDLLLNENEIFTCATGNEYISKLSICDGTNDCIDGSDESLALCTRKENDVMVYTSSTQPTSDVDDKHELKNTFYKGLMAGVFILLIPGIIFVVCRYKNKLQNKPVNEHDIAVMRPLATHMIPVYPNPMTQMMCQKNSIGEGSVSSHDRNSVPTNASEMSSMIHCPLNPPPSPSTTIMRQDDCDCKSSYFEPSNVTTPCSTDVCDESDATYQTDNTYLRHGSSQRCRSSGGGSNITSTMSSYRRSIDRSHRSRNSRYRNVNRTVLPTTPPAPTPSVCSSALNIEAELSDSTTAPSAPTPLLCSSTLTASWNAYDRYRHFSTPPAPTPSVCSSVPPSPPLSPYPPPPTPDNSLPYN